MPNKRKPTITVSPVAWNTDTGQPLKFQAMAELNGARAFSDPQPGTDEAVTSLMETCKAYVNLAASLAETMRDKAKYAKLAKQIEKAIKTDIIQ